MTKPTSLDLAKTHLLHYFRLAGINTSRELVKIEIQAIPDWIINAVETRLNKRFGKYVKDLERRLAFLENRANLNDIIKPPEPESPSALPVLWEDDDPDALADEEEEI